jgi:hypothetical protein
MTKRRALLLGVTILALGTSTWSAGPARVGPAELRRTIEGGAGSQQELVDRLLQALKDRDGNALRRLRVSESEYLDIVVAGYVEPGQPRRELTASWRQYAWANLVTRSEQYELRMLREFGGRDLTVTNVSFEEGEKEYAGYRAYRQLRLTVVDAKGTEQQLRTGSIAEVDGKFKFISFIRD